MTKYKVDGYEKISVMMTVEADSPEEAVEKAWRGEYEDDVDTEPGPRCDKRRWFATEK